MCVCVHKAVPCKTGGMETGEGAGRGGWGQRGAEFGSSTGIDVSISLGRQAGPLLDTILVSGPSSSGPDEDHGGGSHCFPKSYLEGRVSQWVVTLKVTEPRAHM